LSKFGVKLRESAQKRLLYYYLQKEQLLYVVRGKYHPLAQFRSPSLNLVSRQKFVFPPKSHFPSYFHFWISLSLSLSLRVMFVFVLLAEHHAMMYSTLTFETHTHPGSVLMHAIPAPAKCGLGEGSASRAHELRSRRFRIHWKAPSFFYGRGLVPSALWAGILDR
jgi:hypothetical protein